MNKQKHNQKELLYNPKNWMFLAFILSPILPAIFYYRNSKLIGTSQKGKKILLGAIIFVVIFLSLTFIFDYYAILILLAEAITAVLIAKKLAKTQLAAYEEMKKTKDLKGGRNEAPLIILFLAIWITIGFITPYIINKYVEKNFITITKESENPPIEDISENKSAITLKLPDGYILSTENQSLFEKSYQYRIQHVDETLDQTQWKVFVIPIKAVQHFDTICAPGDCMRDLSIFPRETDYFKELEKLQENDKSIVTTLNGQKYYIFTTPTNGDSGYSRQYITYFNNVRVIFTAWTENQSKAETYDNFISEIKILDIK